MQWNKTSKVTPKQDKRVLAVRKDYPKEVIILNYNEYHKCWDDAEGDDYYCDIEEILYWCDLPEAPTGDDDE